MKITSLAVFCASKYGKNPIYETHARTIGQGLAAAGVKLVYGGGSVGLMGAVANACLEQGGIVTGIIPEVLLKWEQYHKGLTELLVVPDMHVRKRTLYEQSDAALILPGGFGTMDELFEMLTWNQLKIHEKKIFLLNSAGFYDGLIIHLQKLESEGLLYDRLEDRVVICSSPEEVIAQL
jgi:hypothetical protein